MKKHRASTTLLVASALAGCVETRDVDLSPRPVRDAGTYDASSERDAAADPGSDADPDTDEAIEERMRAGKKGH